MHSSAHTISGARSSSRRIVPVDATRGLVMMFSCLAHFAWWTHGAYPDVADTLNAIGMIATPTFLLISGAMAGLLCGTAPPGSVRLKEQFVNRGLFLLTVGHFLIALSEAYLKGSLWRAFSAASVVDEIGLCTLLAAFLTRSLADEAVCRNFARAGAAVFVFGWSLVLWWHPMHPVLVELKEALVGGDIGGPSIRSYTAPSLQYAAIYAMGLPVGHLFARYSKGTASAAYVQTRLLYIGLAALGGALLLRIGKHAIDLAGIDPGNTETTLRVTAKLPPSPAYLLFYGGVGLVLASLQFRLWNRARAALGGIVEWFAVIGRASLFVFILQYFLFWTLPDLLGIQPNRYCALVFLVNVLIMRVAAGFWGRLGGNRWLTLGLRWAPAGKVLVDDSKPKPT